MIYQIDNPKIQFIRKSEYYIRPINDLLVAVVIDFFLKEHTKLQYSTV